MDHASHAAAATADIGMIACTLVSWALAAACGWKAIRERYDVCGEHRQCLIACAIKFALMPPAMSFFGWWGMTFAVIAAGAVMFWPLKGKK